MNILNQAETTGQQLKKALGIEKVKHAVIQKVIDIPINMYIVSLDSRYASNPLAWSRLRNLTSFFYGKAKLRPNEIELKHLKLTPPIDLNDFNGKISTNAVVTLRDVTGDRYVNTSVYSKR